MHTRLATMRWFLRWRGAGCGAEGSVPWTRCESPVEATLPPCPSETSSLPEKQKPQLFRTAAPGPGPGPGSSERLLKACGA